MDQGDELVVLLVVPSAQAGDVVAGVEVDTVGVGDWPDPVDVSGVVGQIGVTGVVDQPGRVQVNVLDEDGASDDLDGVLARGGVREVDEVGGGPVVVSNI